MSVSRKAMQKRVNSAVTAALADLGVGGAPEERPRVVRCLFRMAIQEVVAAHPGAPAEAVGAALAQVLLDALNGALRDGELARTAPKSTPASMAN